MAIVLLGLIGLVVGLALDALVVPRLVGVPPDDGVDEPGSPSPVRRFVGGEAGALVLSRSAGAEAWTRRLLIVGATAGLFAAAGARFDEASHVALVSVYACVFLVCAATDALSYRVPNAVTYPAMLGALVLGAVMPDADIVSVLAGGLLAAVVMLVPSLLTGGAGMGMGDVKLATFAGLALGFEHAVAALLITALAGGVVAALLLATGLRRRGEPIPYAPFISAGALAVLLWQGPAFVSLI